MTRLPVVLIAAAAVLAAAGTATAGPCERLAGARWVHYIEGGRPPGRVGVGVWDFRQGASLAPVFAAQGAQPLPEGNPSAVHGQSYVQRVESCRNEGEIAVLVINVGASINVAVSMDGKTATTTGGQNLAGMTGWARRGPN